ncbi:MAG: FKBP-type peptidyl-prolyl cis-trans isomerase [Bacteroidales bacterium]|nr:FKBP-type peptidyl-prolyl cis-trans isomerase [Bacteroidales bacterium]
MRRILILTALVLAVGINATAQHQRFKKTRSGLQYRYETRNRKAPQPKVGDVLVGEMTMMFGTDTIFSTEGHPQRIFHVAESAFPGDINEGLLMMHKGETMVFAVQADSVAERVGESRMPPDFRKGGGQTIYYTVELHDILSPEQIAHEQDSIRTMLATRKKNEGKELAEYVQTHYTSGVEMTLSGLYIVIKKKGNGLIVTPGKAVVADYVGRTLDGKVFDTSIDSVARAEGIHQPKRPYGPLSYVVGQTPLIPGWEQGVYGQPEGTELTILIPSSLAYGERGAGDVILPYTSLIFDIKILKVEDPSQANPLNDK